MEPRALGGALRHRPVAFGWIILNPANGFATALDQAGFVTALWLFVGFGLVSLLFWAWFRIRPAPAEE